MGYGRWLSRLGILGLGVAVVGVPWAAADEWTLRTGVHVDAWSGSGQSGHEILAPFSLAFDTPAWGVSFRGAYGNAERNPGDAPEGSITGFTDTTLSGYYRLTIAQTDIQAGLDLGLPTGISRLKARQLPALQDRDLVALDRFGKGFDINPTIVAYRNFGAVGVGLGLGYLKTGEYDQTADAPNDDFDPGDELTVVALGDAYVADVVRVLARASYTYFTADERSGVKAFREGDELDFRVTAEWRPEPWYATVTLRDVVRFKAERPDAAGRFTTEPRNSNGNDFQAAVTVGYILTDAWTVEGSAAVRHVAANDYPVGDPLRDGGRTKVAFGPAVAWSPTRTFSIAAGVAYFILEAKQSPLFPRDSTFRGVHADVRVTYRF